MDFEQAVKEGDAIRVQELLAADTELANRPIDGVSPLLAAVYHGHGEVAGLIANSKKELDIFEASALGNAVLISEILARDPGQANALAPDGFTPLTLAAAFGNESAVAALIKGGADVNMFSKNEKISVSPLHAAAFGRNLGGSRALIESQADVHAVQPGGFTPLHTAAQNGDKALVTLLLSHGADKSAKTADGKTPRNLAIESGHADVAELL